MSDLTTDNTAARMYYVRMDGDADGDYELVPSPNINLSIENFYANESIIGYTYNVTLTGYAASKQSRGENHIPSIGYVVGSIAKIQNIFDSVGNGGKLVIKQNGTNLMIFKGGRIKSINFSPSNNQWVKYSEYTIELEFNDAELYGCNFSSSKGCTSTLFDGGQNGTSTVHAQLVDHGANAPTGYKIKSFSDKWNIDLQDDIYDWAKIHNREDLRLNSKRYNIQYNISAVGQHYWDDQGNLFPAWKQAKAFCQDRLVKQINGLYTNMAMHYEGLENKFCGSSENVRQIHSVEEPSIHQTIGAYFIYNETITYGPSESDGSFDIAYSAIVKRNFGGSCVSHPQATHTLNITYGGNKERGRTQGKTAILSGSIQGLLKYSNNGSIIWPNAEGFRIPDSPNSMVFHPPQADVKYKWSVAKELLDKFLDESTGGIRCKELAEIVTQYLESDCHNKYPGEENCGSGTGTDLTELIPNSFTVNHNYGQGTIDYSAEFSPESSSRCNITITVEEPVPLTAEFTIPGVGIYYQLLGGTTAKKWTINAEGKTGCGLPCGETTTIEVCGDIPGIEECASFTPPNNGNYLLTSNQKTYNPVDGSFSYNATYVCTNC